MIDQVTVFSKTGLVLWNRTLCKVNACLINTLIRTVLLEEKGGECATAIGECSVKWSLGAHLFYVLRTMLFNVLLYFDIANDFDIIFVVVYQRILQLLYVEDLLEALRREFVQTFKGTLSGAW